MQQTSAVLNRPGPPAGEIVLTYDDYACIPNDGKRYEIIEGDLFVSPAPTSRHQRVLGNLHGILYDYLKNHPLGDLYLAPIDLILSQTNVVQPDLLYLSKNKLGFVVERGIEGPPDLVVEVLSPSTEQTDRTTKARLYAQFGIDHYWIIDPLAPRLEPYRLSGKHYQALPMFTGSAPVTTDLFPALAFALSDL